jgi:ATP-dependent DNA helicase RecG
MTRLEMQEELSLSDKRNFNINYLIPALKLNLVEMTIPDKPKSRNQRYRLTNAGKELKKDL